MELQRWRYFLVLAEELHYERAALRVGIDQASFSRKIRQLEHALKLRLIERSHQGTRGLTPAGRALLPRAQKLIAQLDDAVRAAREAGSSFTAELRVGMCDEVLRRRLAQLLGELRVKHPKLDVQLVVEPCEALVEDLRAGVLDIGVSLGATEDRRIEAHEVWSDEARVVMAASHPLAVKERLALTDLAGERLILDHRQCACGRRTEVDDYLEAVCARVRIKEVSGAGPLEALAVSGYGIGLTSAEAEPRAERIVRALQDQKLAYRTFVLYRKQTASRFSQAFVELGRAMSARCA